MLKRRLGKTNIELPVLGFGAMELRNMQEEDAIYLMSAVLDLGISFIDTSPDYARSEEFIGKAVSHRRGEFLLASKCGCDTWTGGGHVFTRERFAKNLENSLRLLRTEYIDIWQIHGPTPGDLGGSMDDAIAYMQEQKKAGKVGTVSVSFKNGGAGDPRYPVLYSVEAFEHYLDYGCFDSIQTVYGGLTRDCEDSIAAAADREIGIIVRGILNRYTPEHKECAETSRLDELCEPGETVNDLLIRFAITTHGVTSAIVGSSSAEHMKQNIAAAERGPLSPEVYAETKKRLMIRE